MKELEQMALPPVFADVTSFLNPRSVAIVGASDQERSLGGAAVRYLQKFKYPGFIWPVHPTAKVVSGLPAYRTVNELPEAPDLVILAIAASAIPALLRECANAGIHNVVVWAGGFSEGGAEGSALQEEVSDICRENGISLLGPNCIGIINTVQPLVASFASFLRDTETLSQGNISMIGQSGGLVTMAMAHAANAGFGFRYAVSTGNEAVLSAADFIAACVDDPGSKVIAVYLEGTRDGEKLLASFRKAKDKGKPIVLLRGGRSEAAARAAAAHTGALAGESRVWNAVLAEFGVIETRSLEELLDVVQQLSSSPSQRVVKGNGVAIVTFGGGSGVLSADQCERRGLATPPLLATTQEQLGKLVPPIASTQNPIDLTPQVYSAEQWLEKLPKALDVIASDPGIDAILLQFGPMAISGLEIAKIAKSFMDRSPIPTLLSWPLAPVGVPDWLREQEVNVFIEYDRAVRVLSHLVSSSSKRSPQLEGAVRKFEWNIYVPNPSKDLVVSEHNCHRLLSQAGIPVALGLLVSSTEEAIDAGKELGWPIAMKGMSQAVTHKAAAGLVKLNIDSPAGVTHAMESISSRANELNVELEGTYVQHMYTAGIEILVSAFRDPTFGVIVSCGAGGVFTEVIDDVVLHRAPFGEEVATDMLRKLRIVKNVLRNGSANLPAMATFLKEFSELVAGAPWRKFVLEVNPVKWSNEGAIGVDGLLIIAEP